ncbi:hypothetical protein LLH03_04835 [bacterium]|nr:hypothetical protein [bacterium]
MRCDKCGETIRPGDAVCAKCGASALPFSSATNPPHATRGGRSAVEDRRALIVLVLVLAFVLLAVALAWQDAAQTERARALQAASGIGASTSTSGGT